MLKTQVAEISFKSLDGTPLSGTLSYPENPKGFVITVHGSMVQTRNGDLDDGNKKMLPNGVPHRKLFIDVTNALSEIGLGTFRYDKRASGKSGGKYEETNMDHLAQDVVAAFNFVRSRFADLPIGVVSQSEGGLTTLRACELGLNADFHVLQGPLLEPLETTMVHQKTRAAALFLEDKNPDLAKNFPYLSCFYKSYFQGDFLKKIKETNDAQYLFQKDDWIFPINLEKYRQWQWNGLELLKKVKVPTLVVIGEKDGNIRAGICHDIEKMKIQGLYPNVTTQILPGLEHSYRLVKEGLTFIEMMKQPISTTYIALLKTFCSAQI